MEHWAPLIQTVLWVGLIGGTIYWARKPLHGILTALHKRIDSGSNIKAGIFSLEDLKPQTSEQQAEKMQADLITLSKVPEKASEVPAPPATTQQAVKNVEGMVAQLNDARNTIERITASTSQAQAFLAEDLALRTIQTDFKVPVQRQLTGGRDGGFDGVFEVNGQMHVVEVKYIGKRADPLETAERIKGSLQRLLRDTSTYGWSSTQFILAAVFASAEVPAPHREAIEAMCLELGRVTPRFYTLGRLKRQWGIDAADWDDKIYK